MKLSSADLKKLQVESVTESVPDPEERVLAILRVRESGYVPEGVHLRSRIDGEMFTAELAAGHVAGVRADKRVVSVEVSKTLPQID